MGTAFVEVRDQNGAAIPGFTLADEEEIGGNFIDQLVYWMAVIRQQVPSGDVLEFEEQTERLRRRC